MNLNHRLLPLFCLLTLTSAFAQEETTTETVIPLHVPQGELVHFKQGDYILSFGKEDLLRAFEECEWIGECSDLLPIGDTLNLDSTKRAIWQVTNHHYGAKGYTFEHHLLRTFREGRFAVYSIASGKNLSQMKEIWENNGTARVTTWDFADPLSGQKLYSMYIVHTGCPSF